jgi:hypothetical protein
VPRVEPPGKTASTYVRPSIDVSAARSAYAYSGPAPTVRATPAATSAAVGPTMPRGRRLNSSGRSTTSSGGVCQNALFHALTTA